LKQDEIKWIAIKDSLPAEQKLTAIQDPGTDPDIAPTVRKLARFGALMLATFSKRD
jgi:hypothetical protein